MTTRNLVPVDLMFQDLPEYNPADTHVLLIAINRYRQPSEAEKLEGMRAWSNLECCLPDAKNLEATLVEDFKILPKHVYTLYDVQATRSMIIRYLAALRDQLKPSHNLIIFFAGHGLERGGGVGYWIPHDALHGDESSYLHNSVLQDVFKEMKVRHLCVISDSCYSASLLRRGVAEQTKSKRRPEGQKVGLSYRKTSRWLLASGDEPVPDNGGGGNSPFMTRLLQYLRAGDKPIFGCYDLAAWLHAAGLQVEPVCEPFKFVSHQPGGQMYFCRVQPEATQGTTWLDRPTEILQSFDPLGPLRVLQEGQNVGWNRFFLKRKLGQGRLGEVWLAEDKELTKSGTQHQVALRFLAPYIYSNTSIMDVIRQEVINGQKLSHCNIIHLHDLHTEQGGSSFVSMEYFNGLTLKKLLEQQNQRPWKWTRLAPLVQQFLDALIYAHGVGVIHSGIKPANLMVDSNLETLRLVDFGLAKVFSVSGVDSSNDSSRCSALAYMSPQMLDGGMPTAADDIYSLGVTLYELLTGTLPFQGTNEKDLISQIHCCTPLSLHYRLSSRGLDHQTNLLLNNVLLQCIQKDPMDRPESVAQIKELLRPILPSPIEDEEEVPPPPPWWQVQLQQVGRISKKILLLLFPVSVMAALWFVLHNQDWLGKLSKALVEQPAGPTPLDQPLVKSFESKSLPWADLELQAKPDGCLVRISSRESNLEITNYVQPAARYALTNLPPGHYWIEISNAGFESIYTNLQLMAGKKTMMSFRLTPLPENREPARLRIFLEAPRVNPLTIYRLHCEGAGDTKMVLTNAITPINNLFAGKIRLVLEEVTKSATNSLMTNVVLRPGDNDLNLNVNKTRVYYECPVEASVRRISLSGNVHLHPSQIAPGDNTLTHAVAFAEDLWPGEYQITFTAPRYQEFATNLLISGGALRRMVANLLPLHQPVLGYDWTNSLGMRFVFTSNFWVCATETTVAHFRSFTLYNQRPLVANMIGVTSSGWKRLTNSWNNPNFSQNSSFSLVGVSWQDCQDFCEWLTRHEQQKGMLKSNQWYALPTDAQWSWAAGNTRYPWGNNYPPSLQGNYSGIEATNQDWYIHWGCLNENDGYARTAPPGKFKANQLGLYDMGGNVAEWCADYYQVQVNSEFTLEQIPFLKQDGGGQTYRIVRGASWYDHAPIDLESQTRYRFRPEERHDRIGFRVVIQEAVSPSSPTILPKATP